MHDVLTTIMEVVAVLFVAVGLGVVVAVWVGPGFGVGAGMIVSGVVLFGASAAASRGGSA